MLKSPNDPSIGRQPFLKLSMFLILVSLLSACASGLKVRSEIDTGADFSRYATYNYFDPMGIESGYNSPVFGELFREAIGNEMSSRGYQVSNNPDFLINVTIRGDEKISIRSYTSPYMSGGYYGQPGGAYYGSAIGVGIGVGGTRATVKTEASVFIDFVDITDHKMVWQGVAVADVTDKVAQRLRDAIFTATNEVLAQYPYTAGN